jgi:hypothetical protein
MGMRDARVHTTPRVVLIVDDHEDSLAMYALGLPPCLPDALAFEVRDVLIDRDHHASEGTPHDATPGTRC